MIQHVNDSTCNTWRYFAGCTVFLHALKGQGKIQAMRKMFACIMLNNQIKDILLPKVNFIESIVNELGNYLQFKKCQTCEFYYIWQQLPHQVLKDSSDCLFSHP